MKQPTTPPRWAYKLLTWFHPDDTLEEVEGDLDEMYQYWYQREGKARATIRYVIDVISVLPPFVRKRHKKNAYPHPIFSLSMFRNYFKIALRNLLKQKAYSLFNLLGLSLGITCGLLLTLHIKEELSYEKNIPNHNRIFRVANTEWSKSSPPLAGEMIKFFPEIKSITRFASLGTQVVNTEDDKQGESVGFFADSTVVEVFDLQPVLGNPVKALAEPSAIIITRSMAEKYFGSKDPIGQKLTFENKEELWVRAVIEDRTGNTHLKFDYLASMPTFYNYVSTDWLTNKGWMFGWTYVLLNHPEDVHKLEARMKDFYLSFYAGDKKEEILKAAESARLQPITDIHLKSNLIQEVGPNSSILYVYIFIAVEVLVLIIACVNFINLFTTQALKRMKEVGVRKVLGARKVQLVIQFLGESFLLTCLSGIIAIVLYLIALPFYNHISGRQITGWEIIQPDNLLIVTGMVLFVGLLSGLFPAFFISNFEPVSSLKANKTPRSSAQFLRKGLIVFQFVVASFLIIATVLIYQQMYLFNNKQLGFDKEQIVVAKLYGKFKEKLILNPEVIQNELLKNPNVVTIGKATNRIGDDASVESVVPSPQEPDKEYPSFRVLRIDENYLNAMSIPLKAGRNFSREFSDSASFIINEKAAKILGLKDPIGATITNTTMNIQGKVVGVVKDFHFVSLHNQIEPLLLEYRPWWTGNMFIKIKPGNVPATLDFLQNTIQKIAPGTVFKYEFLDDHVAGLYKKENTMSTLLKLFSILSIIISCLGLFGLAAHTAEIRTKEIGIRKILGATLSNLVKIFSQEFILLVLIGNIIAWPLAWYAVNRWLQEFTYRIDISWDVFVLSAVVTLCIALVTIGYHCIKTALSNPVNSLRTE
ncbi:permease prefix domain 2-containing transporter [Cytophagaceae bacterium YF14B1]|uniref:Permease prefix domain 2-containing transporter n=1 Tax=Xanthocytophaga flava TaxID=3048013 RepID=A0AAE3UAF4_9BACT|nr:FtsX-like permease family protein [Xanthocytophaga flavus]MDJ1485506.1 permease prefix domain 2-containing transporter [Xanthocytophaga flavus]